MAFGFKDVSDCALGQIGAYFFRYMIWFKTVFKECVGVGDFVPHVIETVIFVSVISKFGAKVVQFYFACPAKVKLMIYMKCKDDVGKVGAYFRE